MTEADILASTYDDICTVYRTVKKIDKYGESIFKEDTIYENIICALSFSSGGKINQSKSTAITVSDYQLFVRPEIDIQANDKVVVTRLQKEIVFVVGLSDYHVSHNSILLSLKKEEV